MKKLNCLAIAAISLAALSAPAAHAQVTGNAQLTTSHAHVDNGYGNADVQSLNMNLNVRPGTVVGLSVSDVRAWGGHAMVSGISVAQDLNDRVGVSVALSASDTDNITIRNRASALVKYKALPARNLILGVGAEYYDMRGGGKSNALLTQAVYYVPSMPLVLQADATFSESRLNSRRGNRFGAAATYGRVKDWTAFANYSTGRVHYELVNQLGTIADYDSTSYGTGVSYWLNKKVGVSAGVNRTENQYFHRNEARLGMFWDF